MLVDDYWPSERQLIQDVLKGSLGETGYRRQLVALIDQCTERDTSAATVKALPALVCRAHGGNPGQAASVCAAWRLSRFAAKLFDDVEDGDVSDRRAEVINLAVGLVFAAQLVAQKLAEQGVAPERAQEAGQALSRACLVACGGQSADLGAVQGDTPVDPDAWLEIAAAKSGALLGWAAWAGALVAGAGEQALAFYRHYGSRLGVLLQIADDYNDVWHPNGKGDLAAGRPSLALAYGLSVASAEQGDRLQALLDSARQGDVEATAQARQALTDLGAQAFLWVVARTQQREAM